MSNPGVVATAAHCQLHPCHLRCGARNRSFFDLPPITGVLRHCSPDD